MITDISRTRRDIADFAPGQGDQDQQVGDYLDNADKDDRFFIVPQSGFHQMHFSHGQRGEQTGRHQKNQIYIDEGIKRN